MWHNKKSYMIAIAYDTNLFAHIDHIHSRALVANQLNTNLNIISEGVTGGISYLILIKVIHNVIHTVYKRVCNFFLLVSFLACGTKIVFNV